MAFRRQIEYALDFSFGEDMGYQGAIGDIAFYEGVVILTLKVRQRVQVSRVGQQVQHRYVMSLFHQKVDQVASYKSGSAGG